MNHLSPARIVSCKEQRKILSPLTEVPGAIILIHSNLIKFGIPEGGIENLWHELYEALGKHRTIIMPTFTFTNGGNQVWDWHKSKSEVGVLTEYFRTKVANYRTVHPLHSLAMHGPEAEELSNFLTSSSFGKDSIWDSLTKRVGVTNLSLGIGLEGGATFLHNTEEVAQVPYREYIEIDRQVFDKKGNKVTNTFRYFARSFRNDIHAKNNWIPLIKDLTREGLLTSRNLNSRFQATIMDIPAVSKYVGDQISRNQLYLGGF